MSNPSKTAVVIGAGIVGLASACRLAESGYQVTVIEQRDGPGGGTSKANAGQLLFDRIGAMGSPAFLRGVPNMLLDRSQGVSSGGLIRPSHWGWTAAFLRECTSARWRHNTRSLLDMAHRSADGLHGFMSRHEMSFDWRKPGKLTVYASQQALDAAAAAAAFEAQFGGRHAIVTPQDCLTFEPALTGNSRPIAGAVHLPDAEVGDCHACCGQLANVLTTRLGGQLRYETGVTALHRAGARVTALETDNGPVSADLFVIATGMAAHRLLPRGSFPGRKPIVPVKGFSVTFPAGTRPPDLSVTDSAGKFVILRLGDRVRLTGGASFTDDLTPDSAQIAGLIAKARALMPNAARWDVTPVIWTGLRPQTPDDLPMIGRAGADNLFVNAGHGSLGWTLAFGAADYLLDSIAA